MAGDDTEAANRALDAQADAFAQLLALSPGDPDRAFRDAAALARGLFPHQIEGVAFLLGRTRAILADDMGLGKTRQAIVALRHARPGGPYLVVCPASVKRNWAREIGIAAPERVDACRRAGCGASSSMRVGDRQLRHPRQTHRHAGCRALGGARLRRGALPEEPSQRAKPSGAATGRSREGQRRRESGRLSAHRNAADEPAPRPLRAAPARRPSARTQLPVVRETLLRGRKKRLRVGDARRLEHRGADGAAARRDAAPLQRRRPLAAAEDPDLAAGGRAEGHGRARHEKSRRAADRRRTSSRRDRRSTSGACAGDCCTRSRGPGKRWRPQR